jgi:hypothetical protein
MYVKPHDKDGRVVSQRQERGRAKILFNMQKAVGSGVLPEGYDTRALKTVWEPKTPRHPCPSMS